MRSLCAFACCALAPIAARAGAWSEDADHWLVINQFDYYQADVQGYNQQGRPAGHGTYKQFEFSPYIEYGVTPDLTIGSQPRLQYVNLQDGAPGGGSNNGVVQVNLFARYSIYKWDFDVLSFQAQFDIPGAANHPQPQVALTNLESEARLLYGHSFDMLPWSWTAFFDGELAFRYIAGAQASQTRWDMTLGVRPQPDWLVLFQTFFTFGLHNQRGTGADYDLYRLQLSVVKQITDNISLQIGGWHDAGGRNIALGNAIIAAIWFRF
jgi:hypothetical protein